MSSFRIRPRFTHTLNLDQEELLDRLHKQAKHSSCHCWLKYKEQIVLRIPEAEQHFWSPQLQLNLEEQSPKQLLVRGLYGPHPHIWALFFYAYAFIGVLSVFMLIIGLSQYNLGETAWGLWVAGVAILVGLGLYILAQMGQKLGVAQTFRLHHCYEEAVSQAVMIS